MIIFGSRMYFRKNIVHTQGHCPKCERLVRQKSYDARKFGHVYFIPIFPCARPARVLQECARCGVGTHVPQTEVPALCSSIASVLELCVEAAERGQHHFDDSDGDRCDTGTGLTSVLEMLTVLNCSEPIDSAMARLDQASYEWHVAQAVLAELAGDLSLASTAMQDAARENPTDPFPIVRLADYAARSGKHADQLLLLDRATELADPDEVAALKLQKLAPLEALQEFGQLFELMGQLIRDVPELAGDKKFAKERQKAEKRARKLGQI